MPEHAELIVVNTCAVTAQAASDSRQKIRQTARAGPNRLVVTGCWATLQPGDAAQIPGVSQVILNPQKDQLVPIVLQLPPEIFDLEFIERELYSAGYPSPQRDKRTRAFIKAQDGCDNRCTFCITTVARGPGRSRPLQDILADVHHAQCNGVQEVVLTGVHLGSWGQDLIPQQPLKNLVQAILRETDIPRLRLSSLEPWDIAPDFFELWANPRVCRHLHLPLQSGCATTLRRMARKVTPSTFAKLVDQARTAIPGLAITTDIIVGFPGETEQEFDASQSFVRSMQFSGGHVFTYSARPGTAAATMPQQVAHSERKTRNAHLRAILAESKAAYQAGFVGQELKVLWEIAVSSQTGAWELSGLSDNYLRISAQASRDLWNQISSVRIIKSIGQVLVGELAVASQGQAGW